MSNSRGVRADLGAADADDAADEVDGEVARGEERRLAFRLQAVAERGAEAGDELAHAEGLGHVVVGAEFQRLDDAGLVGAAREDDDRDGAAGGAPAGEELLAGGVGQAEVEDHEVGAAERPLGFARAVPASITS